MKATSQRRLRRRVLIGTSVCLGLIVFLLACGVAYLRFGDLERHREACQGYISDLLGRELSIDGVFQPQLARTVSLVASDISLANAPWSSESPMLHIKRFSVSLDLFSVFSGPLIIHDLDLHGVRVMLEADAQGRGNWEFDFPASEGEEESGSGPILFMEHAVIKDLSLIYQDETGDPAREFMAERLEISGADGDLLHVQFQGRLDTVPVDLSGQVGPLAGLLENGPVQLDLAGHLAGAEWTLAGEVVDLAALSGTDARLTLQGSDLAAVTAAFQLQEIAEGAFRVDAKVSPVPEGYGIDLTAEAADVSIAVDGSIDSLLGPQALRVSVEALAPDLAALGALAGLGGLPVEPIAASGRVAWGGGSLAIDELQVEVGPNSLAMDGVLGELPRLPGTDFHFSAQGPDLASFSSLAGIELPAGRFRAEGRLLREDTGVRVEAMQAHIGRTDLEVTGFLGDPTEYVGTALTIQAGGPDLSAFNGLAGVELPAQPFEIGGGLQHRTEGLFLESMELRLGGARVSASGTVVFTDGLVGTELHLEGEGEDLELVGQLAGQAGWPADPFSFQGRVRVGPDGYAISDFQGQLAGVVLGAEGLVGKTPGFIGTEMRLDIRGADLSWAGALVDRELPARPFQVAGDVKLVENRVELRAVEAQVGGLMLQVEGHAGLLSGLDGTSLSLDLAGSDLGELVAFIDQPLPRTAFAVKGQVGIADGTYRLGGVVATAGENRMKIDGEVVPSADLAGTRIDIEVSGPDLVAIGLLLTDSGIDEVPALPEGAFSVGGSLEIDSAGYLLRAVEISLQPGTARVDGRLGTLPELHGTDLVLSVHGPDSSLLEPFLGLDLPPESFELSTRFAGTPENFSLADLAVRVGGSDLAGSLLANLRDKPEVSGTITSEFLDLSAFLGAGEDSVPTVGQQPGEEALGPAAGEQPDEEALGPEAEEEPGVGEPEPAAAFVFSDEPFDLSVLDLVNVDLQIDIGHLVSYLLEARRIRLGLSLRDGTLQVDPLEGEDPVGGALAARFTLAPLGGEYQVGAHFVLEGFKVDLTVAEDDPDVWPSLDIDLEIQGVGRSPHILAAGLSGHGTLVIGEGRMDNSKLDSLVKGIFLQLFSTLNPFVKEDQYTELECLVMAGRMDQGDLRLEPVVMATDKMVILGHGDIDFATEELSLDWVTKPRKGLGIAATALTNALIRLGGTLADPKIQSKGLEGAVKGSLSVLTLGIADRISAERKVCKKALKKIAEKP